jgi:hypothetical protein
MVRSLTLIRPKYLLIYASQRLIVKNVLQEEDYIEAPDASTYSALELIIKATAMCSCLQSAMSL